MNIFKYYVIDFSHLIIYMFNTWECDFEMFVVSNNQFCSRYNNIAPLCQKTCFDSDGGKTQCKPQKLCMGTFKSKQTRKTNYGIKGIMLNNFFIDLKNIFFK